MPKKKKATAISLPELEIRHFQKSWLVESERTLEAFGRSRAKKRTEEKEGGREEKAKVKSASFLGYYPSFFSGGGGMV